MSRPTVLFVCVHNAGRSQMAAGYLQHLAGDKLQVALFHPEEGAVNLYTGQRHANWKQRILAKATSPVCLVPDCRHAADHCEVHHVVPGHGLGGDPSQGRGVCGGVAHTDHDEPSGPRSAYGGR